MQKTEKELTPEEKHKALLRYANKNYRIAIRWLREAKLYKEAFHASEWKDGVENELHIDSQNAFKEAAFSVLKWRKLIDKCNEMLINIAAEKVEIQNGK